MTEPQLPMRQAVRALMIDHADRVLMVKLDVLHSEWVGWVLPGGGIEPGETEIDALRRELREETGLSEPFLGPVVCHRRQVDPRIAPGWAGQEEAIYLVPCHDFGLEPALAEHELRGEGIVDMRWFTLDDLRATAEIVVPENLVGLLERVLEFGGSLEPLVIDIDTPVDRQTSQQPPG